MPNRVTSTTNIISEVAGGRCLPWVTSVGVAGVVWTRGSGWLRAFFELVAGDEGGNYKRPNKTDKDIQRYIYTSNYKAIFVREQIFRDKMTGLF